MYNQFKANVNAYYKIATYLLNASALGEEADALCKGLNKLERAMYTEAEDQLARERLLSEFPKLKPKLEEHIRKLHELADEVDRVHKNCTISNIVAGTTGATSGLLSILGLGLAPFTAGASLVLFSRWSGAGSSICCGPSVHQHRGILKRVVR
ncbi:hypothetical protein GH733_017623 [Mirounga leonina]|nr:hypothetical protein GH733_017623 [Mirounga leonina]